MQRYIDSHYQSNLCHLRKKIVSSFRKHNSNAFLAANI